MIRGPTSASTINSTAPLDSLYAWLQPRYRMRSSMAGDTCDKIRSLRVRLDLWRASESCSGWQRSPQHLLHPPARLAVESIPSPRPLSESPESVASGTHDSLSPAFRTASFDTRHCETCAAGAEADSSPDSGCLPRSSLR